ncbi:MAG: DUF4197 domain-containing protein [Chitinophagales bacterium]|nr:DUF4197 domain-containing protein [Chitinophagales bacterium]
MKKTLLLLPLLAALLFLPACETLQQVAQTVLTEPSLDEIGRGLKEALGKGVTKGAGELAARDGFLKSQYKILLPAEARKITDKLKNVPGFNNLEAELLEKINRGAEEAAKEAAPIFLNSIKQMTIQDATNILMGEDNAATAYLQRTTTQELYGKFNPKIVAALNNIGANELYRKAADTYNKIPLVTKVNNDLDDYVTNEALKGLFGKISEEEKNIRRNTGARTSDLLKKVFAKQDTNRK